MPTGDVPFSPLGTKMNFIRRFFAPKASIHHPVFGQLTLQHGKKGPYWMHDSYSDDDPAISIETLGTEPPSSQQVAFYQRIADDIDAAFANVAAKIVPKYEKWLKRPFPKNWRDAFTFAGLGVPINGDTLQPWDITFELRTENLGYLFTCYFENGNLVQIGVDT